MNLIDTIFEEICSDDVNRDKQSHLLENLYQQGTEDEKDAIDKALTRPESCHHSSWL